VSPPCMNEGMGRVVALLASALLVACSARGPDPRSGQPSPLPRSDTGAIDVGSLEGRITFSAGSGASLASEEIYLAEADGSGVTRLTRNEAADFDPTWSPDGSRIAFRSQRDGNDEIYVLDVDDGDPRNITREEAVDWGPDWSPDGRWIAFNSGRDGGRDLHGFLTDPEGREVRPLGDLFFEYPAWSPDGTRIAFMHQTFNEPGGNYDIFVMNADGTGVRRLTSSPADDGWPAWSADGSMIAFSSIRDDCRFDDRQGCKDTGDIGEFHTLYVMNADGSEERRVTEVFGQFSVWSPDGRYIAFSPAPGGIYVMRPDGSDLTLIPVDTPAEDPLFVDWEA
jgi:Tol biopolymer transport system component